MCIWWQLREDLDYSQTTERIISADCEDLEIQLHEQGHTARKRLQELSRERDSLQNVLENQNSETREACAASIQTVSESLASQTEEAVKISEEAYV